ncbi:MAG: MFS transporter [Flavobacteriales bacterium]|nr:MFS transporter [Flavobacteriales bacterium]
MRAFLCGVSRESIISLFSNTFGGIPRAIWMLSVTQFINRSGTMVIFFASVYLHTDLGISLPKVGIIMAMFGAGSMVGVYTGGWLVDRIGYFPVMLVSLMCGGCMFFVVSLFESFVPLCIGMFMLSALGEAYRPANMAAVSVHAGKELFTRSISLNRLAINLGFAVGPALGGLLAAQNYKLIFYADGITSLAAAMMVFLYLKPAMKSREHHAAAATAEKTSAFTDKPYLWFLAIACAYAFCFFQFFTTLPLYYKDALHMSETRIGWLMGLNGVIVAAVEMFMIYKIENKWRPLYFVAAGSVLLVLAYLMMLVSGAMAWLVLITVIISFSEMLAMPFMTTYMNSRASAHNRGQYASLYVMAWSLAQIIAPVIATQFIENISYNALWIFLAGVSLLLTLGARWLNDRSM